MSRRHRLPIQGRGEAEHPIEAQRRREREARELAEAERQRRAAEEPEEAEQQEEPATEPPQRELGRRRAFMAPSPFRQTEHPLEIARRAAREAREADERAEAERRWKAAQEAEASEPESDSAA